MLSRWFKRSSRLEHADRDVRLQALQTLDAEQAADAQEILENIIRHEADLEVRSAAMPHVVNPDVLSVLLDDEQFASSAAKHIAARIQHGQAAKCHNHDLVVRARLAQADAGNIDEVWPLLTTTEYCAELAMRTRDAQQQRVLAHPLLASEDGLSALLKLSRGKDKVCHRHAREALDKIKQARGQCTNSETRLLELDTSIDKTLKAKPTDAASVATRRQKLIKLKTMRAEAATTLAGCITQLEQAGGAQNEFQISADPLAEVDLSPPAAGDDPFAPLAKRFSELAQAMIDGTPLTEASNTRDELVTQWLSHADGFPPTTDQHHKFESVSRQFQAYKSAWDRLGALDHLADHVPAPLPAKLTPSAELQTLLTERQKWRKRWQKPVHNVAWPKDHTPPEAIAAAEAELGRINAEMETLHSANADAETKMAEAVKLASKAIEAGQLEATKQHLRAARNLQKAGVHKFDRELATLSAQTAEFTDWQKFATSPKRQELLTELQALADSPQEPLIQADRLRTLREQWRQLGRPSSAAEITQQQQFDGLAEIAHETCKAFFAEQAAERTANLEQRIALCDQLDQYLTQTDWASADMQAAEKIMRSAREEWHRHHPCERKALKPVQQRFEKLQDQLHAQVKLAWDANVTAKQNIVQQAKDLLDQDGPTQVEGAKALQQTWRQIGSTPRGPDQRLWREFRQICDQIFSQRDADKVADQEALAQQHTQFEAYVDLLEEAAKQPSPSRKALDGFMADINATAAGLTISPTLRKRTEQAKASYLQSLKDEGRKKIVQDLQQWQTWDEQVSATEQNSSPIEAPHPVFTARIEGNASTADWLALTLEAEIAADLPSQPDEQSARMALQIEFINAGRRNLANEDYRELRQRWCEAGPKDSVADGLRQRFFDALMKRL